MIAVIGDGSMSAGMAYEAMNNAAAPRSRLIVILNDNDMSIAPPVGAMSGHLARLVSGGPTTLRQLGRTFAEHLPRPLKVMPSGPRNIARGMVTGGTLFEELGFYYVGPIDGHNLDHLVPVLKNVRDSGSTGRCWSMSSPRRARATRRPKRAPTSTTAWRSST